MTQRILKPLSFIGLLDETFDLYKKNFWLLIGIAALLLWPAHILVDALNGGFRVVAILFVIFPLTYLVIATTTQAVSERYLGQTTTIFGAYRAVMRRGISSISIMLLIGIIIGISSVVFLAPGIILACRYVFIPAVLVLEGKTGIDARSRGKYLADKEYGRIIPLTLVNLLILVISVLALGLFIGGLVCLSGFGPRLSHNECYSGTVIGIAMSLAIPIHAIIFMLLYYDIRVRKEGFDVEMLASELEESSKKKGLTPVEPEASALN